MESFHDAFPTKEKNREIIEIIFAELMIIDESLINGWLQRTARFHRSAA